MMLLLLLPSAAIVKHSLLLVSLHCCHVRVESTIQDLRLRILIESKLPGPNRYKHGFGQGHKLGEAFPNTSTLNLMNPKPLNPKP